jgi:hypothetical protein
MPLARYPNGVPKRISYPLARLPAYPRQASRYAPVRNGLVIRSTPTVVAGP